MHSQRHRNFSRSNSGPHHGRSFGRPSGRSFNRPHRRNNRINGTTINVSQLINKVNDKSAVQHQLSQTIQNQFDDFKIDPRLKNNIKAKGYLIPTPIQDQAIPVGLQGKDVIGLANTGTGKTMAFLIPILNKMVFNHSEKALILAPTRELALQIFEELRDFGKGFGLGAVLCIGGNNISQQIRCLRSPYNFIIGTPGRIIDLLERRVLNFEKFQNIVLDEADRMVDMGFINDIRLILSKLPRARQSFFFTATLSDKVEELIRQFLINPVKISVKTGNTVANITQDIVHVPSDKKAKFKVLVEHVSRPGFDKVLVFGRTKFGVEKIATTLFSFGIKADSIHGNKSQNYRQKALQKFKRGEVRVLVATDVAARGLDINGVSHVINFDLPANYDDYIHRIGRTGRADKKGIALTFVDRD